MISRIAVSAALLALATSASAQPTMRPPVVTARPGSTAEPPRLGSTAAVNRSNAPEESDTAATARRQEYLTRAQRMQASVQVVSFRRLTVRRPYVDADTYLEMFSIRDFRPYSGDTGALWSSQLIRARFPLSANTMYLLDCHIPEQRVHVDSGGATATADYPTDSNHLYLVIPPTTANRVVSFDFTPAGSNLMQFNSCELSRIS